MSAHDNTILVDDVGKAYVEYASELARIARWFGANVRTTQQHWVLRHVSLRVARGEAIGIIGQNGAGKSTLLKMIAGTTQPTEGSVSVHGRIAALLELGLGFNAELTGRENVVHAASLMGVSADRIAELLPQIEAFAEIGEYFDQPLRMYSSGMQMRVAFSVATCVRPDVLIVDEALAVGDTYFVHKCFQRIREFREAGTTLLFVSHDPGAVQALCDRAVLIERGRVMLDGAPKDVIDYYNALIAEKENATVRTERADDGSVRTQSGTGEARFDALRLCDATGRPIEHVLTGQSVVLHARVAIHGVVPRLVFGYMIRDRLGQPIYGTNTHYTGQAVEALQPGDAIDFRVAFDANLGPGSYSISVALADAETHLVNNYEWKDLALTFTVSNADKPLFVGSSYMAPRIDVARAEATP